MRGAMRAGAKPVVVAARKNIHSVSGDLARSIKVSVKSRGSQVKVRIVAGGPKANLENRAIWVEFGTRPHLIKVSDSDRPINARASARAGHVVRASITTINRALRNKGSLAIRGKIIGPHVKHPGARPKPYMRPALDAQARNAVLAVANYIKMKLAQSGVEEASSVEVGG